MDAAAMEAGRLLFAGPCQFIKGAVRVADLPELGLPEVAFAGRSNVGKSSLVNALTGRGTLARTSNTPGRTRELNFFDLGGRLSLVDLPGYGYAVASKTDVARWSHLVEAYLKGRPSLSRACILIDARHGLKKTDAATLRLLDEAAVAYVLILTKADKLKPGELAARIAETEREARSHAAAYPKVFATSARTGAGVAEVRAHLAALAVPESTRRTEDGHEA